MTSKSQQLAKEEANVTQAMAWLESHQSGDVLHKSDQTFSFDVVAKDARLRTQNCQNLRTAIKGLQESCQLMGTKVNEAQAAIRNSLSTIREKEGALEAKKAELAALRSVEQAVAIARGLNFEGVNGEISGRFIKELDRRITTAKAGMEFEQVESFSTGIVPWESEDVQSDLNFVRAYQRQNMGRSDQPENVTPPAPLISEDLSGAISDVTQ